MVLKMKHGHHFFNRIFIIIFTTFKCSDSFCIFKTLNKGYERSDLISIIYSINIEQGKLEMLEFPVIWSKYSFRIQAIASKTPIRQYIQSSKWKYLLYLIYNTVFMDEFQMSKVEIKQPKKWNNKQIQVYCLSNSIIHTSHSKPNSNIFVSLHNHKFIRSVSKKKKKRNFFPQTFQFDSSNHRTQIYVCAFELFLCPSQINHIIYQ